MLETSEDQFQIEALVGKQDMYFSRYCYTGLFVPSGSDREMVG